ncbi:MAG: PQQ-dependent sugar dehydrogenase [Chitinophagaceae bacterium]|nr:MAG: PQQ-dependent sugar dehydrogenase [Chitinophagaceae bacterium]
MKHLYLVLIVLFVATSCKTYLSKITEVEVGEVPQQVEDVFIENPEGIQVEVWQENLVIPWSLVFLPDGSALVSQRTGSIIYIKDGDMQNQPYAVMPDIRQKHGTEGGLMGLAVHPDFENQPYVYAKYTFDDGEEFDNRVVRFRHAGNRGIFDKVILKGMPAANNHNGGRIKFGPDGMLYIATGEIFDRSLPQDMNSLGGKFLRVKPDGDIPPDNPFPDSPIYTLGHRNAQGIAWHPETGDLFSSEHGPSGEMLITGNDIINIIYPGKNYGWPRVVGQMNYPEFEDPIIMWSNATPPSGMDFWNGDLYVATLRSRTLIRIELEKDSNSDDYSILNIERWFSAKRNEGTYGRLRDVVVGPDNALYVLTSNRDGRGSPQEGDDKILRITKK